MKRPFGVSLITVMMLLYGLYLGFHAMNLWVNRPVGDSHTSVYTEYKYQMQREAEYGDFKGSLEGAVILLVLGAGLWFMEDYARLGTILVAGFLLGQGIYLLIIMHEIKSGQIGKVFDSSFILHSFVYAVTILYLTRIDVRHAFSPRDRSLAQFDPSKEKKLADGPAYRDPASGV